MLEGTEDYKGQLITSLADLFKLKVKHGEVIKVSNQVYKALAYDCPLVWRTTEFEMAEKGDLESDNLATKAIELIYGDREKTHGQPDKNIQLIADFWTGYIKDKTSLDVNDVCNMMALLKIARSKNNPDNEDNDIDSIGYTLLKERVRNFRASQESVTETKL